MKITKPDHRASVAALALMAGWLSLDATFPKADAACCYFAAKDKDINQPGQKAFITWSPDEKRESFTVQPKFEGNAVDFGMVIPTPARPKLDEMPRDFFKDLAIYTILMPLPQPIYSPLDPRLDCFKGARSRSLGMAMFDDSLKKKAPVRVLESGVVGSLDYKIIVAEDAGGLFDWLKKNQYSYAGDESTLQFYINKKWFFTVMRIDPKQMKVAPDGTYSGEVTPTRFTFASQTCIYPLKITQLSVRDKTDALFYVQARGQMDLADDWSWMHSYRPMYLTYMLGCAIDPQQQVELRKRTGWLNAQRQRLPGFETTKLEWARKLSDKDLSVLENPEKNFAQMGVSDLPAGAKVIALSDFLAKMKAAYQEANKGLPDYARGELTRMEDMYQPAKGVIVEYHPGSVGRGFISTHFAFYPARVAPSAEVKGLTRLKGHLQKDQWLTKFRRILSKDEMTHDLVLAEVPKAEQQTYTRIMPTSPP